jgi:2-keto-4-pentenoate hydratase/2-oxohepta-3-ene-1,7-dioic acid hydratase in catechol pathway
MPVQVFGGVGVNYPDHAAQAEETTDIDISAMGIQPFHKSNASLTGCGSPIVLTPEAGEVHYEGELVIVVGRKARHVSQDRALDYVLGYTCGNDVSEKGSWEKDFSLWRSKGLPTWGPVGPWIATDVDPHDLDVTVRLNGQVEHRFNTRDMIHDVPTIVSYISQYTTLFPGDLIFTGTSGTTRSLNPGDVVEVEISRIGTLRNPAVMEQ